MSDTKLSFAVMNAWIDGGEILFDKTIDPDVFPIRLVLVAHEDNGPIRLLRFFEMKGTTVAGVDIEAETYEGALIKVLEKYSRKMFN